MKFLCKKNLFLDANSSYNQELKENLNYIYLDYDFEKYLKRKRKVLANIKAGVTSNPKKNSIKRDYNNSLIQQFINLVQKKGKKSITFKSINIMIENIFFILTVETEEFKNYDDYDKYVFLHNTNPNYSDINTILYNSIFFLESIFEIKTKKNNKRLKLPDKYSHEIVYIPPQKRLKYVLQSLNIYSESFKNYSLWERLFWSFLAIMLKPKNSLLLKKRNYIYLKSIKFFKKKK